MKEIGGYIELDRYTMPMLHDGAMALNCGRNCLAYLIHAKRIEKIILPYFLCSSVQGVCRKEGVKVRHYHIGIDFMPEDIILQENEWLYVVNYYGQLDNMTLKELADKYKRVIVDDAQSYYQMPVEGVDTFYTCRKYYGVPDGAFLYTDVADNPELPLDESFERMHFLLGRFERGANEFYQEYVFNNKIFVHEPIKQMSRLTENLLRGIDYKTVGECRQNNFVYLDKILNSYNKLKLIAPFGAFMYPLFVKDGPIARERLARQRIYVPLLWPNVLEDCGRDMLEYDFASNILPLPIDQRYDQHDMEYIAEVVKKCID